MAENQKSVGLKVALPNGSLEEGTLSLFEEANLNICKSQRRHAARIDNPLISQATFMRPQHIPRLVAQGTYDVGICGLDCVEESEASVVRVAELPYGRGASNGAAKVVLVASTEDPAKAIEQVEGGSVVLSEYPNITRRAFALHQSIDIRFSYGGTEAHIPGDYRYGVCLTDTGASLTANGLKVIAELLTTCTTLIANMDAHHTHGKLATGEDEIYNGPRLNEIMTLKHLLTGTLEARARVFLIMNVSAERKDRLLQQLPALKTPTITSLSGGRYFSVGAAVRISELNQLIPRLFEHGAEDLIQMPVSKVIKKW
ncbi:MAG: ATP phosphoribosyltransferase [Parcubacteria group bacterium Greene0416_79]|nr:MAG: ATP phosphoribosyltransferase [Parcubacteria group bacterium Greene0416_79]